MAKLYKAENKGVGGTLSVDDIYIDDGNIYEVSAAETVAQSTGWSILVFQSTAKMHAMIEVDTPGSGVVKILRNPTLSSTAGASTGTALNKRNRDDTNVVGAGAKFTLTPLISSTGGAFVFGTTLFEDKILTNSKVIGSKDGRYSQWIFGSSNSYGLYFQPTTDGTDVNWNVSFIQE